MAVSERLANEPTTARKAIGSTIGDLDELVRRPDDTSPVAGWIRDLLTRARDELDADSGRLGDNRDGTAKQAVEDPQASAPNYG